jgi:hypothetical protein
MEARHFWRYHCIRLGHFYFHPFFRKAFTCVAERIRFSCVNRFYLVQSGVLDMHPNLVTKCVYETEWKQKAVTV